MSSKVLKPLAALVLLLCTMSSASAIVVGGAAPISNCFPFGCGEFPADRYQQVYAASNFPGSIGIEGLTFFMENNPGGNFNIGAFIFEMSVTTIAVDALDTTNFDNNVTGPVLSTGSIVLNGGTASTFMVDLAPFVYDPSEGNLLMDIKIPLGITLFGTSAFFDAFAGGAGGIFSRAHNFGTGFAGYGLTTEFKEGSSSVPEPTTLLLLGLGLTGLGFARKQMD